ncbi:MAG: hypothetical protein J6X55_17260 [Victivallales bacterium]|nr:hypothetical protein [Victivallales bacterium]
MAISRILSQLGTLDLLENDILREDADILEWLLKDCSSGKNIIWATNDYATLGEGYGVKDELLPELITGDRTQVIQPRIAKSQQEQDRRTRQKAEVFTPSWVCNKQNNLVDAAWFRRKEPIFNREIDSPEGNTWKATQKPIRFTTRKKWQDYVRATRLEITCGEAPYLASRYDTVTGDIIPLHERIGLLDRKLRVVTENTNGDREKWKYWALIALQNIYGYEYQGDNVLLARENILWTIKDYYHGAFHAEVPRTFFRHCAEVVCWNIWQMDGIKYVVPESCHDEIDDNPMLFSDMEQSKPKPCQCCQKNDVKKHNGIRCRIMAWRSHQQCYFMPPFSFEPIKGGK